MYVDEDTTDEFLDGPMPEYTDGLTLWEGLEAQGYDLSDLGTVAAQMRARGRDVPERPPLTEH